MTVLCPKCRRAMQVPPKKEGVPNLKARCGSCGATFAVADASLAFATAPDAERGPLTPTAPQAPSAASAPQKPVGLTPSVPAVSGRGEGITTGPDASRETLLQKAKQLSRGYLLMILRAALRPSRIDLEEVRKVLHLITLAGYDPVEMYQEAVAQRPDDYDPPPPLTDVLPNDEPNLRPSGRQIGRPATRPILDTDFVGDSETEHVVPRHTEADAGPERWFYTDGRLRHGPLTIGELVRAIWGRDDPESALVWQPGMPTWQAAETVPEVAARLPPPVLPVPVSHVAEATPSHEVPLPAASSGGRPKPVGRPSFGRIYAWNALAWGSLSAGGACLQYIETKRTGEVVFGNFVGSLVGSLLLFAPVTALLLWLGVWLWRAAFQEP